MMHNNYEIHKLSEKKEFLEKVFQLLETEFNYSGENKVSVDFFPLLKEENLQNNFILIDPTNNDLIGHIGTKPNLYHVNGTDYPILHLGGIAISNKHQGKGNFRYLFSYILNQLQKRYAFLFLWSDKNDLYAKYDFFPVGGQIQPVENYSPINGYRDTEYHKLESDQQKQLKNLYKDSHKYFLMPTREDWNDLNGTSSAKLFIKENKSNEITSYYIMNKGQDLKNVIHEFGIKEDVFEKELKEFQKNACFLPFQFFPLEEEFFQLQYTVLCKLGNPYFLANFASDFSRGEITDFKFSNNEVDFIFENKDYQMEVKNFFESLWGPQIIKEFFGRYQGLYVPGIESI